MRAGGVAAAVRLLEARIQQVNDALALERDPAVQQQKQRLYNDVGDFLMKGFSGRHWWCSYPTLMTFMMRVLELHPGTESVRELYARMAQQLGACTKCVDLYHASLPGVRVELEFEYTDDSIKAFFHKMADLDAERIQRVFALRPTGVESDDRALAERVSVTLYEVLTQRRLLSDFRVLRALSKWVSSPFGNAIDRLDLNSLRNSSGLYHMLVSPDPGVRAWMTTVVKRIGRIELTGEAGHDQFFISALDEWMFVLETEAFNQPVMSLSLPSTDELEHFLDVTNCAKTPTAQIMWAALDTVMQQMDENSLETMLESFDNLPDLVFNSLDEADPARTNQQFITVISKCYKVLLRCLGHRFWRHTVHSPRIVLTLILDHCRNPAWREFVIKHMIELLPPLLVAMRPPQTYRQCMNDSKLKFYLKSRDELIRFLIHPEHQPPSFQSSMMSIVASNTLMTIIGDCYDHRQTRGQLEDDSTGNNGASKDDGELPESSSVDYSVAESANWWPCGDDKALETLWMSHILSVVTNPKNDASHVDHAALRCTMILRKHLQLARDALYTCIKDGGTKDGVVASVTHGKPIVTLLLERLSAVVPVTLIPVTVHGALFESIGGIAELMNSVASQSSLPAELQPFTNVLKTYENHVRVYFTSICEEVFVKGLINPLQFPIVAQHISICLLSPTGDMDQPMKRMLAQMAASKGAEKLPSPMEAFLIVAHRKTEAFLRGVVSMLQTLRLYDFALPVSAPILKKIVFYWGKVFELLGNDLKKTIEGAQLQIVTDHTAIAMGVSSAASMQRVPILINDFLIAILSGLYGSQDLSQIFQVDEATRIRTLEFGISFWKFWGTHLEQDAHSVSKRATFIIAPLVACLKQQGVASEKARAVQLLTLVLELLVAKRTTALDESTLRVIEGAQASVSAVDPDRASTMPRIIKKLRQLEKSKSFFGRQYSSDTPMLSRQPSRERKPGRAKPLSTSTVDDYFLHISGSSSASGSGLSGLSSRPMSGKAAARVQSRGATVDLTGVTAVSNQAAARKNHSFYSEDDFVPAVSTQQSSSARPSSSGARTAFNMSQLIQGMSKAHPGADRRRLQGDESSCRDQDAEDEENEEEEEEEEEEPNLQYAALYHRIKTTQKPIAVCSLLPFYRQLLQLCMPALLTYEYLNDQASSDRELVAPGLTFAKSAEYVNAFLPLMLEECSNDVFEGLRSCSQSGGHIMRYESEKTREGMRCLNFSLVQVDEGTKTSMNFKFTNRFVPPTTDKLFRNGDIVLLRAVSNRGGASAANSDRRDERQTRQKNSEFMGNREFIGVIMINENEKGKKHVSGVGKRGGKDAGPVEEDIVRVLFLNDGELDSATSDRVASFEAEILSSSALADTEWRVQPASNVVTSAREYIALRSVDLLPEHLRSTILTPNVHKSTQTEIITIAEVLDSLRSSSNTDAIKKVTKLLKRLDKLEISLTDLRSTSIGKMVNKLRKHKDEEVKQRANALKDKWTALIDQKDALERPPRFLAPELWSSVRSQYNQSQLQSIHNVLNNYSVGVSLLQGPPGTGKTKTIMALLSGFLALKPPATALMPSLTSSSLKSKALDSTSPAKDGPMSGVASITQGISGSNSSFSLGSGSSSGSILRRTDAPSTTGKRTTIQSLKNVSSVRSRLDQKLSNTSSSARPVPSSLVVRRRVISNPLGRAQAHRTSHLLLCAPSNGAVNELVLRIVTDGLLDSTGAPVKVRAPSVHADTSNCDWLSIVRLGNPGEDASEAVASVSLPNIIKREMEIHPKTVELRALQDNQRRLRSSIKEFHQNAKERSEAGGEEGGKRTNRKELAKMHAELTSVSGKVRRLRDEVFALKAKMTETILSRASIIACTLSKAGSGPFNSLKRGFDALIIDEAAQAVELSTLVPLRERVARVVLVGDPKQLPATVKSVVAARARYDRSLFERIADSGVAPSMLRVQYRMHPFLREFPSKRFYNGLLTDGPSVMERVQRTCSRIYTSTCFQPFLLYDLPNSREEDVNGSKWNRGEAQFCVQLCETMYNVCADVRLHKWSVGFVSPYREQVNAIRRELARSSSSFSSTLSIEVNTVDGFQGREKDVIIFSCVRSSNRGGIGFLRDIRRLNVAITRARFCLFVVGDVQTLVRDETWDALVRSARDRKLIIHTDGAPFPEVVKRLEGSGKGRELAEHYKEMHERVNRKAAGGESGKSDSSKDDSAKARDGPKQPVKTEHPPDEDKSSTTKSNSIAESDINSSVKLEKNELSVDVTMENIGLPPSAADAASPIGTASTASTASAENPSSTGSNDKKKVGLPERSIEPQNSKRSGQPSDVNDRQRKLARINSQDSERNSKRGYTDDRSSGSRTDRSSGNRHGSSSSSGRDHTRDRSRSRGRDSRRQPSNNGDRRDYRRDYGDNSHRGDSRSRGAQPWDRNNHYGNGSSTDNYGYANRKDDTDRQRRAEERKTMSSKSPASISAKEFCMENEPTRPTTQHKPRVPEAVQLANAVQRALGKRPFNGGSPRTPPSTASSSSNFQAGIQRDRGNGDGGIAPSSSSRSVGNVPNNRRVGYSSSSSRPAQHKRPSNSGRDNRAAGVLGSILGSASQLASSTSRVQDKTKRSNEF